MWVETLTLEAARNSSHEPMESRKSIVLKGLAP